MRASFLIERMFTSAFSPCTPMVCMRIKQMKVREAISDAGAEEAF